MDKLDFSIPILGQPMVDSPILFSKVRGDYIANFVGDDERVIYAIDAPRDGSSRQFGPRELMEKAGPREKIYFNPSDVHAAIVTCGGLCPGLNDVIRAIVMCLWYRYGVRKISGVRYGYRGLIGRFGLGMRELTPDVVSDIHRDGGTILGSSRGYGNESGQIVDTLQRLGISMLFVIGGDGTQKGALGISQETSKRGLKIAVVGVPKTIDNDLSFVQVSFGFDTAVEKAVDAVAAAHAEARGAINGVGLVKVMGRQSGFIAADTALALNDVNFVLVPEVPFELDGDNGLLSHLEKRLQLRGHAVILAAEGAGQNLIKRIAGADASGNEELADIGLLLKRAISDYFKKKNIEINLKFIDPSYIIRAAPANTSDSVYCERLGSNAVHAAMSGRTELLIGLMHDEYVHIPIRLAVSRRNQIKPDGSLWRDVIDATGQPVLMTN
ncbi:MAG: ATP-dependent 6-phosphofructokinase [Planctomycetota bacterium]